MSTAHLKPKPGMSIRTPRGDVLPAEGREEELTSYWRRRIEDGDVEIVPAAVPAKTSKSKE